MVRGGSFSEHHVADLMALISRETSCVSGTGTGPGQGMDYISLAGAGIHLVERSCGLEATTTR